MSEHASDRWVWALLALASAGVIALAIVQGRRGPRVEGKTAPSVSLPLLEGKGSARLPTDKVTIVDFWATWCAPCRASMPRVQKVWEEYSPKGVALYSVDTDDPDAAREAQVREFLYQYGLRFPVVLDDGSAMHAFSIASLPTMVLLDRRGQIVWQHVGALTASREKELRAEIDRALQP